jgi:nitrate/TMAO reductase-like tetraheme cytochrome c subunit/mono/diheme cytochrome c family protein
MAKDRKPPPQWLLKIWSPIRSFFFPPDDASRFRRFAPYGLLGLLTIAVLTSGTYAWEYTNSPAFCGESCHTMPPEFAAYQVSPHARVECVDCHIGGDFISQRITRKAGDVRHVTATLFSTYEYPIQAHNLRPARDTCEHCHYPAKFSDDSLRRIVEYLPDEDNTRQDIYLAMRTGGGSRREGLGRGIHWHVENEVWFVATDELEQDIPYVRVVDEDGEEDVYVALDSDLTLEELEGMEQQRVDCITCHNRISHSILPPERSVAQDIFRQKIDVDIPYIFETSVNLLSADYKTDEEAKEALLALPTYYAETYPAEYREYENEIRDASIALVDIYNDTVFRDQQVDWNTHPNNIGHRDWPGCFRCHDGQHINAEDEAIRLECNLCHSIPQVAAPRAIEPVLPLGSGIQPESHFSTHWLNLHRDAFDQSCQACHTVENPGGTDNSSFCSNSACHGTAWEYANLDAPGLADILPPIVLATPEPEEAEPGAAPQPATETPEPELDLEAIIAAGELTYSGIISDLFTPMCTQCHTPDLLTGGLDLESYANMMQGSENGPVIVPGDAEASVMVQIQREGHFETFDDDQLEIVIEWINRGAPEN